MRDSQFYQFLFDTFANMSAVTKPGSAIYICHADSEGLNFRKAMMDAGFLFKQCIIWNKNTMVLGRQDYQWKHEPILYGWKEGAAHYFTDDRDHTTVWDFDKPARSEEHPTMKPIALILNALTNSSRREAVVLDTFAGSGSTLMACDKADRKCYSMELDPKYVDVIRKRFAKAYDVTEEWATFTPALQNAPAV
jgi:DNA modification methylase